ncbi:DMT family transporter [Intestinimonas butyriciproducens]|nr:DMT family transporter [Intestinimonas butyriciproducens]MDB7817369.1 DMT family transporter [Intestinimonas butyriciproducens]
MVFSAASAVLFGVTPAVASRIYSMGGNAVTLTFYRNLMAVPVLLALLGLEGVSLRLTRREAGLLLLMGAGFRVTTTLMLYQSYLYIPTGMATTLHFLYPALTALLCRARFRERLGPWKLFALGLSGLGALCLLELGAGTDPRGVLLASSSALTYACYLIRP